MCIWTRTYSCGFVEHLPKPHDHDPGLQDPRITICRCNTLVPMASSKAACVVCRSHSEAIRHHTPVAEVVDIRDGRGDGHGGVIVPGPLTAWAKEMGLEKEWLWDENLKATELAPLRYVMNKRHGFLMLSSDSLSLFVPALNLSTRGPSTLLTNI